MPQISEMSWTFFVIKIVMLYFFFLLALQTFKPTEAILLIKNNIFKFSFLVMS